MELNVLLDAYTGSGVLVLFEPGQVAPHAGSEPEWCVEDKVLLSLANEGLLAPINVKADGVWLCRLTTGQLSEVERPAVLQSEDRFWIDVKSHEVVFGGLEALPTRGGSPDRFVDEFGDRVAFDPGRYQVIVHRLAGKHSNQVNESIDDADMEVPSYVIAIRPMDEGRHVSRLESLPNLSPFQENRDPRV